jgi:hypothetical protein
MLDVTRDGPSRAAAMTAIGMERVKAGDPGNARAMFSGAIEADTLCGDAYKGLGALVAGQGKWEAAVALNRRAVAQNPDDWEALSNLGVNLWRLQRFDEAKPPLSRALELNPHGPGVLHNVGLFYYSIGEPVHAIAYLQESLRLNPNNPTARSDLALATLKSGELHRGLDLHEARWELLTKSPVWDCGLPRWEGESLDRKTILVHHEQGFGDTIQFARFLPEVQRRWGGRVILAVPRPLIRLLSDQPDLGIDQVIDIDKPGDIVRAARDADYHCPLMSVARVIGAEFGSLPDAKPYLRAPPSPGARRTFRGPGTKLAVGLVWAASPGHERSRMRSVPVQECLQFGTIPGVRLYSLQVGPFAEELAKTGADHMVTDCAASIADFADTAALMAELDLVIAVDSAPAHIAGALGKPVFMFNPFTPCWRWCRGAEPWYPTMRLFTQDDPHSWVKPIEEMTAAIEGMTK